MKTNGFASSAAALRYWEQRQAAAANNLANVDTHGFKGQRVFARMIDDALPVADAVTDFRAGTLRPTGNPLDLALDGPAFFVVATEQGERYTRGGAFRLDAEGRLVDANGNAVLGEGGPVVVPAGTVEIGRDGVIRVDGAEIDRLRVERHPAGAVLAHAGANLFVPAANREPVDPEARLVRQGFLEDSNVSTIESMVDMVSIQRAYASVQKAVIALDDVRRTIANDLGKPA